MVLEFAKCAKLKFGREYKRRELSFMKKVVREIYNALRDKIELRAVYLKQTSTTTFVFDTYYNDAVERDKSVEYEIHITGFFTKRELINALKTVYLSDAGTHLEYILDIYNVELEQITTSFKMTNPERFCIF